MLNRKLFLILPIALLAAGPSLQAQENGVLGYWKEPQGSVIHVDTCGDNICATLVSISPTAPARVDGKNPTENLRKRTLCGLRIGDGFHMASPGKAEGGNLYDPKSGKTYHGIMTAHGDQMDLRGYIGIAAFGRTERWTRTAKTPACVD
jgi:uncharacterized protein (DUF2147 family)